jgi:hypothetical protein
MSLTQASFGRVGANFDCDKLNLETGFAAEG